MFLTHDLGVNEDVPLAMTCGYKSNTRSGSRLYERSLLGAPYTQVGLDELCA